MKIDCHYKKVLLLVMVMIVVLSGACKKDDPLDPGTGAKDPSGFLHALDKKIADGSGQEFILKGVGLGGWMVQEGYMLGTTGAQHEISAFLEGMAGTIATEQFYADWLTYFVNEKDVQQIAEWGYNSIRLPMHYNLYFDSNGQWLESSKGLELTDNLLSWCKTNKLYLILDLHAAPGGQGQNKEISDRRDGESLWTSNEAREMTVLMWTKLAARYQNEKWVGGYDLLNEPNYDFENTGNDKGCSCNQNIPLLNLYRQIIDAIRTVDKNHLLIIEGNCYGSNYRGLETLANYDPEGNLALSFHNYWGENTAAALQSMISLRNSLKVPLWRGEIGENSNTWFTDMAQLMEAYKIGWANWPWKKINNLDGPVIVEPIPEWDKMIAYKSNRSNPKPSAAEAGQALEKLIENIKLENCRLMHDVSFAYLNSAVGEGAKAFTKHQIPGTIYPTDYDYGKYNESWYDTDYQNTTGKSTNTAWNKGLHYRNDGVDIWQTSDAATNGYFVGKIENGEWLQFTMDKITAGSYRLLLRTRAKQGEPGEITLKIDGTDLTATPVSIPESTEWADVEVAKVNVINGSKLRIHFPKGGFEIGKIEFIAK